MTEHANKREFPRRPLDEKIHTYIQGVRVDASTQDLSAGGMFFRTDAEVPTGGLIALAFRRQAQLGKPIFLVGRVMRRQVDPPCGLGLKWVRAVTQAPPAELEWFLTSLLGIQDVEATQELVPGKWEMKTVYCFPRDTEPAHAPAVFETPPVVAHVDVPAEGALTTRIGRQAARVPTSLECMLGIGNRRETARITHLGKRGLFVATAIPRPADDTPIAVRFHIRSGSKKVPITCQCKLLPPEHDEQDVPGMDLQIEQLDEGGRTGLLDKYLRWLFFQTLIGE